MPAIDERLSGVAGGIVQRDPTLAMWNRRDGFTHRAQRRPQGVPIALVGVLLALMSRGYDNNLYTQVGLVLMIALASKNAILIVEFARDLHADGHSIPDAAVEATRRRFRPIVMTSFAFILGVVPLMVASGAGAASQRAIGTAVFGGMMASTLLAIPFVPVFYVLLEGASERLRRGKSARAPAPQVETGSASSPPV